MRDRLCNERFALLGCKHRLLAVHAQRNPVPSASETGNTKTVRASTTGPGPARCRLSGGILLGAVLRRLPENRWEERLCVAPRQKTDERRTAEGKSKSVDAAGGRRSRSPSHVSRAQQLRADVVLFVRGSHAVHGADLSVLSLRAPNNSRADRDRGKGGKAGGMR